MSAAAATAVCACARGVCVHVREEGKQCGEIVGVLRDDVVGAKQGDEVGASVAAAGPEPHVSAAERETTACPGPQCIGERLRPRFVVDMTCARERLNRRLVAVLMRAREGWSWNYQKMSVTHLRLLLSTHLSLHTVVG